MTGVLIVPYDIQLFRAAADHGFPSLLALFCYFQQLFNLSSDVSPNVENEHHN